MSKSIAVLVRDRQAEALRMAIGLTLMDDKVDVFVLDRPLEHSANTNLNIETIQDLDINIFSNSDDDKDVETLSSEEFNDKLVSYDHIIAY